jgi:hypothetical protein
MPPRGFVIPSFAIIEQDGFVNADQSPCGEAGFCQTVTPFKELSFEYYGFKMLNDTQRTILHPPFHVEIDALCPIKF